MLRGAIKARVSVEVGIALSWHKLVGHACQTVSLEHYGASAAFETLYEEFGITGAAVACAAKETIAGNGICDLSDIR